jgi:hypothetical protein
VRGAKNTGAVFLIIAWAATFAGWVQTAGAQPEIERPDRFKSIADWTISFTVRTSVVGAWENGEISLLRESVRQMDHQGADGIARLKSKGAGDLLSHYPPEMMEMMKKAGIPLVVPPNLNDEWVWNGPGNGALRESYRSESRDTNSARNLYTLTRMGEGKTDAWMTLRINFTKQTYTLECDGSAVEHRYDQAGPHSVKGTPVEIIRTEKTGYIVPLVSKQIKTLGFVLQDEQLPFDGLVLEGKKRTPIIDLVGNSKGFTETRWKIAPKTKRPQVYLEADDDTFLPEPGATTTVSLRWDRDSPDEVEYRLTAVSREPGTCLNSTDQSRDPDVTFAPNQTGLAINGDVARADAAVGRVTLLTHDYAASTELRARARFGNDWVEARATFGGGAFITVPRDEDGNRIADCWQLVNDTQGRDADWDEDAEPKAAKAKGDGFTLFEEYRGVMAGARHMRLNPNRMEVFVLDQDKLLDPATWLKVTGCTAVLLSETEHENQRVDFNSGFSDAKPGYAVRMVKVKGLNDPQGTANFTGIWGQTDDVVTNGPTTSRVFVDRPAFGLTNVLHGRIKGALADKNSPEGKMLYGQGFTLKLLTDADAALDDTTAVEPLVARLVSYTTIHELCHACGVSHHGPDTTRGAQNCVIRNFTEIEKHLKMVQELLSPTAGALPFGITRLCDSAPDNSWAQFRLKP